MPRLNQTWNETTLCRQEDDHQITNKGGSFWRVGSRTGTKFTGREDQWRGKTCLFSRTDGIIRKFRYFCSKIKQLQIKVFTDVSYQRNVSKLIVPTASQSILRHSTSIGWTMYGSGGLCSPCCTGDLIIAKNPRQVFLFPNKHINISTLYGGRG